MSGNRFKFGLSARFGVAPAGALRIRVRAAVAGYMLLRWGVDTSQDHSRRGHEYRLWLKDHLALYGVKSTVLAPEYTTELKADS